MKSINALLFLLLSVLLSGCKDNEDTNLTLDAESLKQTSWSGTRIQTYNGGEDIIESSIGIIFYTTKSGEYDIKSESGSDSEYFEYFVEGKMLFIKENVRLKGYWLVIEKNKNKMVLERSTGGDYSYKDTLVLNRSH